MLTQLRDAATYTYDNQGNMTQMVLTVGDITRTANCTYDGFNHLEEFSDNSGETVYTYDADGLRPKAIEPSLCSRHPRKL